MTTKSSLRCPKSGCSSVKIFFIQSTKVLLSFTEKRQVTYHAEGHSEIDEDDDSESIRPATKKPLPSQFVYPGDLNLRKENNKPQRKRQKRNTYGRRMNENNKNGRNPLRYGKYPRNKDNIATESRLSSSYHKPSVSIMNDVPVEMSFDGAGFLRYEDDESDEVKKTSHSTGRNSGTRSSKAHQTNNQALDDFRKVFNVSRERTPTPVRYDEDPTPFQSETPLTLSNQEKAVEYGTQGAENGTPLSVDFMTNYQNAFQNPFQNGMFGNPQFNYAPTQVNQASQVPTYDPFSFTYPNAFNGQSNVNQMVMPQVMQQDPFMQNHRIQPNTNTGSVAPQAMYSPAAIPQQAFPANSMYAPTTKTQQNHKTQRRKRSISESKHSDADIVSSASQVTQDRYRYSRAEDQQNSGSGFIPITGAFNGGAIQLNFPFYGQSPPSYSHRPPMRPIPAYSMPIAPEGRHYGGSVENFYHPSEARRYSYGILGSGNFEVIRGGVFPGQSEQQNYHGGYHERGNAVPYGNEDYGNYGTTEIIIDGPIQGFQGFDNFPIHLINALSKNSEVAVRPGRRDKETRSA
ncbi:uncharacterized protein TNIN_119281 [Trichonephila inaurata madagascariensis]|uniref:Uncharacterized protein n=1 Tax=Trichonephila inaurata madagascariensis TaxID=2747483 RepID=A0A8X6JAD4_9ARAC|nr:uncharacterized protein TNIN_119281 [Trichonephila inaurata madagascariensis]